MQTVSALDTAPIALENTPNSNGSYADKTLDSYLVLVKSNSLLI